MFLPDVSVWVPLTIDSHKHYASAKLWWDGVSDPIHFTRMTQQGMFRLVTDRKLFGSDAVTMVDAWRQYDLYLSDPRVSFLHEPAGTEVEWRNLTATRTYSPKVWNDAYLAAFAIVGGYELITFDTGFRQFAGLRATILPVAPPPP